MVVESALGACRGRPPRRPQPRGLRSAEPVCDAPDHPRRDARAVARGRRILLRPVPALPRATTADEHHRGPDRGDRDTRRTRRHRPSEEAREALREVRFAINDYRDDIFDSFVRGRNQLIWTYLALAISTYVLLALGILFGIPKLSLVSVSVLYLVASLIGLFNRLRIEASHRPKVDDLRSVHRAPADRSAAVRFGRRRRCLPHRPGAHLPGPAVSGDCQHPGGDHRPGSECSPRASPLVASPLPSPGGASGGHHGDPDRRAEAPHRGVRHDHEPARAAGRGDLRPGAWTPYARLQAQVSRLERDLARSEPAASTRGPSSVWCSVPSVVGSRLGQRDDERTGPRAGGSAWRTRSSCGGASSLPSRRFLTGGRRAGGARGRGRGRDREVDGLGGGRRGRRISRDGSSGPRGPAHVRAGAHARRADRPLRRRRRRDARSTPGAHSARRSASRCCGSSRPTVAGPAHAVGRGRRAAAQLLAADRPVLIAIDDAQWLDESTAAILAYALRRLGRPAGRPARDRAHRRRDDRRRTGSWPPSPPIALERVELGPMHLAALHRLFQVRLGRSFPRLVLVRIEAASGGNPLYALELGRALHPGRDPGRRPTGRSRCRRAWARSSKAACSRLPEPTRHAMLLVAAAAEPTIDDARAGEARDRGATCGRRSRTTWSRSTTTRPVHAPAVRPGGARASRRRPSFERPMRRSPGRRSRQDARARHLAQAAAGPDETVAAALAEAAEHARLRGATLDAAEPLPGGEPPDARGRPGGRARSRPPRRRVPVHRHVRVPRGRPDPRGRASIAPRPAPRAPTR